MYRAKRLSGFVERESGCAFRTLQTAGRPRHMARPPAGTSGARPRTVGRSRPRRASELDTLGRRGICCRVPAGKKGLPIFMPAQARRGCRVPRPLLGQKDAWCRRFAGSRHMSVRPCRRLPIELSVRSPRDGQGRERRVSTYTVHRPLALGSRSSRLA